MAALIEKRRVLLKLKHDLEPWRSLLVRLDSILKWEKGYHPFVIFGTITLFFSILRDLNLSAITLLAIVALFGLTFSYVYPCIARWQCNQTQWTCKEDETYDHICRKIFAAKLIIHTCYGYLFVNQERKQKVAVAVMSLILMSLAWVGTIFDNLVLMYCFVLITALLPGFIQNRILASARNAFFSVLMIFGKRNYDSSEKMVLK